VSAPWRRADEKVALRMGVELGLVDVHPFDRWIVTGGDVISFAERELI